MKKIFVFACLFFCFIGFTSKSQAQSDSAIIFSEIMFNPNSGNNEFIELYNTSETDSIDLANIKIKYYTSNSDGLVSTGNGTKLPPNGFAIIVEGDYDLVNGIYKNLIPSSALILKISDNSFGTSGMANSTDRELRLISSAGDTLETYLYSSSNGTGMSDEKKILNKDNSPVNWGNALQTNGTPGFKNSVTPLSLDLSITSISFSPLSPLIGTPVSINATIKNLGISTVQNFQAELFIDANLDSVADPSEKIFSETKSLAPAESLTISTQFQPQTSGNFCAIAAAVLLPDENQSNNKKIISFTVYNQPTKFNDVIINEIMYAPLSGEPEWIELFNRTNDAINLKKWRIGDNTTQIILPSNDLNIQKHSYAVVAKDSSLLNLYKITSPFIVASLPSFNNTDDAVVVKDSLNILADSLYYFSSWGGSNGRSLERIDANESSINQSNWKTSTGIFKATPGKINSVTQKDFDGTIVDILFSPQNPIAGDNISISAKAKNIGKNDLSFHLELYLDENLDSIPDAAIATSGSVTINPLDSVEVSFSYVYEKFKGTKGFFVKGIFAQDEDTTNNSFYKTLSAGFPAGSVLINEVMFTPVNSEPEWVEVFNASSDTINLKEWTINDVYTTPAYGKVIGDFILLPQTFGVLAKDSSIINYHRVIPSKIAKLNLPVLNNDVDGVVLKDNRAVAMDSLLYNSTWGGTSGFSLERKLLSVSANQPDNWRSSLDIEQSTPGRINSQTPKDYDLTISSLATDQPSFGENENFPIYSVVKNIGTKAVDNFSVQFFVDTDSNHVTEKLFDTQTVTTQLQSGDSVKVFTGETASISKRTLFAAKIIFADDADSLNNYVEKYFEPGYRQQSIIINEVMYNPNDNAPEWIELQVNDSLNLKNWSIADSLSTPTK
ncbi:MAG: lamin tail domain-containing protein, partial [Ignavibacteriaceae bacterium]|nr:lamin tail domain-containing protein [Ignavibacteriaceae bacterium]